MIADVSETVLVGIGVGVAATVTMDLLGGLARKLGLAAGAKGIWVGRWYLGIARGKFVHSDITAAPESPGEARAALVGHFIIGIVLSVFFVVAAEVLGLSPGRFTIAVGYGLATCIFPWFLVLPSLGFGVCGVKGPPDMKLFRTTVLNHFFYGLGLWWSCMLVQLSWWQR